MRPSQRPDEAEGSLTRETLVRVASSPDNDGTVRHCQTDRVRQARREGVREEPAAERLSRENTSSKSGGYGLGCDAHPLRRGTPGPVDIAGQEAVVKGCGVTTAKSQGHSWAPHPSIG